MDPLEHEIQPEGTWEDLLSGPGPAYTEDRELSPFITIFYSPRKTIRSIVDADPTRHVFLLSALLGFASALDNAMSRRAGDGVALSTIMFIVIIVGPLSGILTVFIGGVVLKFVGGLLGGQASRVEVRAALAWSSVPQIFALVPLLFILVVLRGEAFTSTTPNLVAFAEASPLMGGVLGLFLVGSGVFVFILGMWTLVLNVKCLGEVHQFSAWRALASLLLVFLALFIPLLCVVILVL